MNERQTTIWDEQAAQYPTPFNGLVELSPTANIQEAFIKHYTKFREFDGSAGQYKRIMVSISGGSDSDILIDMIERIGYPKGAVRYVFFNTGIEFQATKDHIKYLEQKYGVMIEERKAKMPTPAACRKYGVPFLSKRISDYIGRLQHSNFQWEDGDYDTLIEKYPGISTTALKWWCNAWGDGSQSNICRRAYLKEFMIENPPDFQISDKCCIKSKKDTAHSFEIDYQPDLAVQGVRKGEGGVRASAYTNCFDEIQFGCSRLRLLFWFLEDDKREYEQAFDIEHSRCYTQYGLKRTGCACCPFGRDFEHELSVAKQYEPSLYKAAMAVFGKSYEYTRKYIQFRDEMKKKDHRTQPSEIAPEPLDGERV